MGILKDTCIFIHKTQCCEDIVKFIEEGKSIGKETIVTNIILDELQPTENMYGEIKKKVMDRYKNIETMISDCKIVKIDINADATIKGNYDDIRKKYYSWMTDSLFLKRLIDKGEITMEEIKSSKFRLKDAGECSLVAVAMTNKGKYIIVSDDKGDAYKRPEINIYSHVYGLNILTYDEFKTYVSSRVS